MEALLALFVISSLLVAIGLLANRYGTDSRSYDLDDWSRRVAG